MSLPFSDKIQNILIRKGFFTEDDLKLAREESQARGSAVASTLIRKELVQERDILAAAGEALDIPVINLSRFRVAKDVLDMLPEKVATSHKVLPLSQVGNSLTVAMVEPTNVVVMDDIKLISRMNIVPVLAGEDDINDALRAYYEKSSEQTISDIVEDIETAKMEMVEEDESARDEGIITEDAPVVKLTNLILSEAVKEGASDILIEPMEGNTRVRYRVDGILKEHFTPPKKLHSSIVSRLKVMAYLNIAERRLPQDGRFRLKVNKRRIDFRVSIIPSSLGEKVALRILDKGQATIDIDRLGLNVRDTGRIKEAASRPHGMILVCGPTGCGKTTTLYSVLKYIDTPGKNLVTVEDPVEYELEGINQVSIKEEIGLTFASCLRSILRQDPDIVMVGEIRDYQTIDIAIKAALTGHMVLSTLHTNTASGSIVRMTNMGVEPFLIASSVEMIAAQRLIRKLCPDCRQQYELSEKIAEQYGIYTENGKMPIVYKPKGCDRCMGTGYRGRVAIIETMLVTEGIKALLFRNAPEVEFEKLAKQEGMKTLRQNAIENFLGGVTSLEEVVRVTVKDRE